MTAKEARHHDDGRDDPDNPKVPFRMSDRQDIYALKLKVNVILAISLIVAGLAGSGMALTFLHW